MPSAPAMMAIMLAVATAVGWGASDYFGGDASGRDTPVFTVVAMSELLGLIALAPALAARGIPHPASPRLVLAAARKHHPARHALPRRQWAALAAIAVTGTGGDLAYTAASHHGTLSIVSAISSLYPVATIALGRLLQGRRATRTQRAGITLALVGAVLLGSAAR